MSTIADFFNGTPVTTPGQGLNTYKGYNTAIQSGIGNTTSALAGTSALANQLRLQAQGVGPSLAQEQERQNNQRVAAQAAGSIASQKGINPGLAGQLIARNQANVQGANAGQTALTRQQEQMSAQSQLGNVLGQQGSLGNSLAGLGTQGQLGQNSEYISQQQLAAQEAEQNAAAGQAVFGDVMKLAGAAAGGGSAGAGLAASMPSSDTGGYKLPNPSTGGGLYGANFAKGGKILNYVRGGGIPGKAKVAGNSSTNDTVPIMASPGEIMIPRSITQSANAGDLAKQFVEQIMKKKGGK